MKVYSYFANINFKNQKELIDLWRSSWSSRGFEPILLTEEDAKKHLYYTDYIKELKQIHIDVLDEEITDYGMSCYLRWMAYATIDSDKPILTMDYDIINTGLDIIELEFPIDTKIKLYSNYCPCFVSGTPDQFDGLCRKFVRISKQNIKKCKRKKVPFGLGNWYHDNEFFIYHHDLLNEDVIFTSSDKVLPFDCNVNMEGKAVHVSHSSVMKFKQQNPDYIYKGDDLRTHLIKTILLK